MAGEKRLILLDHALQAVSENYRSDMPKHELDMLVAIRKRLKAMPTVDAVEVGEMREFAQDVAYQFGYYCQCDGRLNLTHGGLSVLEWAFEILGWDNLHPVPECECEFDGCHEHATCGTPTKDGYKRMCGKHFREEIHGQLSAGNTGGADCWRHHHER